MNQPYPIQGVHELSEVNQRIMAELYKDVDNNQMGAALNTLYNDTGLDQNSKEFNIMKQNLVAYYSDFEDGDDVYDWNFEEDENGNVRYTQKRKK